MSGMNGDKARFNMYRRRKLAKRQRVWAFFAAQHAAPKPAPAAPLPKRLAAPSAAAAPPAAPPAEPKPKRQKPAAAAAVGSKKSDGRNNKEEATRKKEEGRSKK